MNSIDILFLSQKDVISLDLTPLEVIAIIEEAFLEHANETYEMHPKIGVHPIKTHPANFIHAMPAYLKKMEACGLKWVSGFAKNYTRGLPNVSGIQVYNDIDTGIPLAIMDCSYLTGLRTAAVSAVAAKLCANPESEVLGLAGCGFQGTMHVKFLTTAFPSIKTIKLIDVRKEAAKKLKDTVSKYFKGEIKLCDNNEDCVKNADIISTCTNGDDRIIQKKDWFKEGAFGVGIEGGCAYTAETLHQADKFIVDDIPLVEYFDKIGKQRLTEDGEPDPEFPGGLPAIYSTIGNILAKKKPGRENLKERIIATPIGLAICDIALTKLIYNKAIDGNIGKKINLA